MSDIYYICKQGGEAETLIAVYIERSTNNAKKTMAWVTSFAFLDNKASFMVDNEGQPVSFLLKDGCAIHLDWKEARDGKTLTKTFITPKKKSLIPKLDTGCAEGVTDAMFGKTPVLFHKRKLIKAVSALCVDGRRIVGFYNQAQIDHIRKHGTWPKGLRPIKTSSVELMKERDA